MANLNSKWVNLVFCIDKSGSMLGSESDIIGGFNRIIQEQKQHEDGKVTVSMYTFSTGVQRVYLGKDINEIYDLDYQVNGLTAMNDGIGRAIDEVGEWLHQKDLNGEELPGLTLFVVMTDGAENASTKYSLAQVKEMIKRQTEVYSWQFIYEGCDITSTKAADDLGFKFKTYSSKLNLGNNYDVVSCATKAYRNVATTGASLDVATLAFCSTLDEASTKNTKSYEEEIGTTLTA